MEKSKNHEKGFNIACGPTEYGKVKVGAKILDDAVLNLGSIPKANRYYGNKQTVLKAMADRNYPLMREISNFFYNTNGIYATACNYVATMYRYDWYLVPEVYDKTVAEEKILKDFNRIMHYLDNTHIKQQCNDIALSVVKDGAYYGYIVPSSDGLVLQQLPVNYCRSRYSVSGRPAVEFNMKFFDDSFRDVSYRMRILKMFPKDFQKGYNLYKQGKLEADYIGESFGGWYLLDPDSTIKFSFSNADQPLFINSIPEILDLDAAQDLDRRKQMQKLLKIVIQKLPTDKNGDLVFDLDEATDIHNNAVEMLSHAIGVDVLTTFADVDVEDMADSNTTTSTDDLEKMERAVYNSLGISKNLFNTDGNLSLSKSILADESAMRPLLLQLSSFYDSVVQQLGRNKSKYGFRLYMLETTQDNYQTLAKMYKEQVQIGYSKMLPQIAMGHSQSSIIHMANFENEVLHLSEIMIPPLMSSTMNAEALLGNRDKSSTQENQVATEDSSSGETGRPEKSDDEKSEKTIANLESMS